MTEREKVTHLLRRFGLGASEAELDYYAKDTLKEAIDKLIDYDQTDEGFGIPIQQFKPANQPLVPIQAISAHWYLRLLSTRRPLQEKLTLFWHDHFATSASKVNVPPLMYQQIETLRQNATGKFEDILLAMSKDPAMLFWLDNQFNVKGKPNENFAREVMELFTLGVDNGYTEHDVAEAARAFTGWSFRRQRQTDQNEFNPPIYVFTPRLHDDGEKTIFGKTGPFNGEDVVKMLCEKPQTARYIAQKMWAWFAYENPDKALVDRLATKFRDSGLSVKVLVRSIMEAPEFYSERAERKLYKNPVDFVIPTMRMLGIGEMAIESFREAAALTTPDQTQDPRPAANRQALQNRAVLGAAQQTCRSMGMDLLFPPDVNGWEGGAGWVTSATMVERILWADKLFGVASREGRRAQVPAYPAIELFPDPSPAAVSAKLQSLFDVRLPADKSKQIEKVVSEEGPLTRANANTIAAKCCRLIFGTPEFQFC